MWATLLCCPHVHSPRAYWPPVLRSLRKRNDEAPIIASIAPEPREIVARILSALNIVEDAAPSEQTASRPSEATA
jgi:hypothetical protein